MGWAEWRSRTRDFLEFPNARYPCEILQLELIVVEGGTRMATTRCLTTLANSHVAVLKRRYEVAKYAVIRGCLSSNPSACTVGSR